SIICSPMTSLKTSIKTITYLSDIGCLEIQGASLAAKGHQKAIIVYQDTLQTGKYDTALKSTVWSDYKNEKLTNTISLRYLVRFTLVDVATGEWAAWSPVNYEYKVLPPFPGKNEASTTDMTEQQIIQLKQKTYKAMVKDLVNRYQ
ncbi:hypothetical protein ACLXAT_25230, partial [Escherichia coli]